MSPPLFVTGGWVDAYPEDIKSNSRQQVMIWGNHSATHSDMNGLDAKSRRKNCSLFIKVKELTGADMTLFRPSVR